MCQRGAVLVSRSQVYVWREIKSHHEMLDRLETLYPRRVFIADKALNSDYEIVDNPDRIVGAEYDFMERKWGLASFWSVSELPDWSLKQLAVFESNWFRDLERLFRFMEVYGMIDNVRDVLTTTGARKYEDLSADAEKKYDSEADRLHTVKYMAFTQLMRALPSEFTGLFGSAFQCEASLNTPIEVRITEMIDNAQRTRDAALVDVFATVASDPENVQPHWQDRL